MSNIEDKRFFSRISNDPLPAFGFGGFLSIVAYSVYNYRKRDRNVRTSVYVIHTRMAAQGFVIALLTGGVCYKMISKMTAAKKEIIPAIALPKN